MVIGVKIHNLKKSIAGMNQPCGRIKEKVV